MPTIMAALLPVCVAMLPAMGARAAIVPTLVPVASEMKQAARKRLLIIKSGGTIFNANCIVASMAPICFAVAAKAPAKMKIHNICITLGEAAPAVSCSKRWAMGIPRMMNRL